MAETILVIEDERLTRTNLLNFLGSEGFSPLGAENGRVGIQLAQAHLPDLIICDIMMPDLDGYDVLTTLQQDPATAAIPFIFLTMTTHDEGLQQSLAMGADDYLSKPITSEELRTAIATQLKHHSKVQPHVPRVERSEYSRVASGLDATVSDFFLTSKDRLLEELCQTLLRRLASMRQTVERIQGTTTAPEHSQCARDLQEEFTRLLAFVNEVSAIQKVLNSNNAASLMEQFTQSAKKMGGVQ